MMIHKAQKNPRKIVYAEGEEEKIIRAANSALNDNISIPILIGNREIIEKKLDELGYEKTKFEIVDPNNFAKHNEFAQEFYKLRQRKGLTLNEAKELMKLPNYLGSMLVLMGDAHALIGGLGHSYPTTIKPALETIGVKKGFKIVSGLYIVIINRKVYFLADTTVNVNPNAEQLAEIAISAADTAKQFDIQPVVAMLSFSNFGSTNYPESNKVRDAVKIVNELRPDIIIDGEMQADTAVVPEIIEHEFPFAKIRGGANVLIFPNLDAGNIAYKLLNRLTEATVIGPILMGMKKPVHVLQRDVSVDDIINLSAIAAVEAMNNK